MNRYELDFVYGLFGETASKVLLYIARFGDSYPTEIARNFDMGQRRIQYQMEKLENSGILKSRLVGRTRTYRVDPRYVLRNELMDLLRKAIAYIPEEEMENLYTQRRRPRTRGKALRKYPGTGE